MPWAKSAKGRGILNILGNKRLYTWAKRTKYISGEEKKKIGNTNWDHSEGHKIYFSVQDYDLVLFSLSPAFWFTCTFKNGYIACCQA